VVIARPGYLLSLIQIRDGKQLRTAQQTAVSFPESAYGRHLAKVNIAAPIFAFICFSPAIATLGNLAIQVLPQPQTKWNVQHWCECPQTGKSPCQVPERGGTAAGLPRLINHEHLLHHLIFGQLGKPLRDFIVMQRKEGQSTTRETVQPADGFCAKTTMSIVDYDVSIWRFGGRRQGT
jgi:hypothetical protein